MESYYFVMFFMTKRRVFRAAGRSRKAGAVGFSLRGAVARRANSVRRGGPCGRCSLCRAVFAAGSFRGAAFGYSPSSAPPGRAGMSVASSLNSTGRSPSLQEQIATPGVRIQSL